MDLDHKDMEITEEINETEELAEQTKAKRFSWPLAFTIVFVFSLIIGYLVYLDFSKKVSNGGENITKFLKEFVQISEVSKEWTHFGESKTMQNLQVSLLKTGESFNLEWKKSLLGLEEKAEIKVDVPVRYYYYLDLKKEWQFHWDQETNGLIVIAPPIEFNEPAIDYHKAHHQVIKTAYSIDEDEMTESLKKTLPQKGSA